MKDFRILWLFLFFFLSQLTFSQVVINEIMASNSKTLQDQTGRYPDWIEIYNPGNTAYDLHNHFISDNKERPNKFQLKSPNGQLRIPAKGYLIIFCSGDINKGANHISFSLSAESESVLISRTDGRTIIDAVDFEDQRSDVSYGRQKDGENVFKYFIQASPGKTNNLSITYIGKLSLPVFSHIGGFYQDSFVLSLSHPDPAVRIIYSLDGSDPTPENLNGVEFTYKNQYQENPGDSPGPLLKAKIKSENYKNPITVIDRSELANRVSMFASSYHKVPFYLPDYKLPKATIIRAAAYKEGYLTSEIASQTYYVKNQALVNKDFSLVSVITQESNLFDFEKGIYTAGKTFENYRLRKPNEPADFCSEGNFSNYFEDKEKPSNFELFKLGQQKVNQPLNIAIHGGCSRSVPNKSLRIYGKNSFKNYPFFPSNPELVQRNIILRNSGNDYNETFFKDAYIHDLMGHLNFGSQKSEPSILYLNGEYWGIHNIRERLDKYYLNERYGVGTENIDMRKVVWTGDDEIEYGDGQHFDAMMDFLRNNDLSTAANYQKAITYLDPQNLIDYQIAEIFIGNVDWPQNNVRLWRNRTPSFAPLAPFGQDGRWRFLFFDTDKSLGVAVNAFFDNLDIALQKEENFIFRKFLANSNFKNDFILRFTDQLNSAFSTANSIPLYQKFQDYYRPEVPNHVARWKPFPSILDWEKKCNEVISYLNARPESTRDFLKINFSLKNQYNIDLQTSDSTMGYIKINTLDIKWGTPGIKLDNNGSWRGKYFEDIPMKIVAKALPGYKFLYWERNNQKILDSTLVIILKSNEIYKAFFEQTELPNQKNIPAASLIDCGYFLNEWSTFTAKSSHPANARFVFLNQKDPTKNAKIAGFTYGAFNHTNRTRISGQNQGGFSFVNTGGPAEHDGYPYGQLGGMVMALNTVGIDDLWISYTTRTIQPGNRKYAIKLQYRINENDDFKDIENTLYTGNNEANHSQVFENIALPKELTNKPYVQLFWKFYYTEVGNNGNRDELGIDDIRFKTNLDILAKISNGQLSNLQNWNFNNNGSEVTLNQSSYSISYLAYENTRPKTPKILANKLEICGTEKLKIKATGCVNGTLFWSNGKIGREIEVIEGNYTVYCSSSCGISENAAAVKIKRVERSSAPEVIVDKEIICQGEVVTLSVKECNGSVYWNGGLKTQKLLDKPTKDTPYTAFCFANKCFSEISKPITVKIAPPKIPKVEFNQKEICLGNTVFATVENCSGTVTWNNGNSGNLLKFSPTKTGEYNISAKCKSRDGECESEWSENQTVRVSPALEKPWTLVQVKNECDIEYVNLDGAILDTENLDKNTYTFHVINDPNSPNIPNVQAVGNGNYFVYKRNNIGCVSPAAIITAKSQNCFEKSDKFKIEQSGDLAIDITTNKISANENETIDFTIKTSNLGRIDMRNIEILTELPQNALLLSIPENSVLDGFKLLTKIPNLEYGDEKNVTFSLLFKNKAESIISSRILKTSHVDDRLENNLSKKIINEPTQEAKIGIFVFAIESLEIKKNIFESEIIIEIKNYGDKPQFPYQVALNLDNFFGNGAILNQDRLFIEAPQSLKINNDFKGQGRNIYLLLDSLNLLNSNSSTQIKIKFEVDLSKALTDKFYISAQLFTGNGFAKNSANLRFFENEKIKNIIAEPTLLQYNLSPNQPEIAVSQAIVDSEKLHADLQEITFLVQVKNIGNVPLKNIKLQSDLSKVFSNELDFITPGHPTVSSISKLKTNKNFNGKNSINLLEEIEVQNELLPQEIDSVFYTIKFNHKQKIGPYFHNIVAIGETQDSKMVTDTSNNGLKIIPHFSDPTIIKPIIDFKNLVEIKDGFSPNGDGLNDALEIFIPNGLSIEWIDIIDKWGSKLKTFSQSDVNNQKIIWDGDSNATFKSKPIPSGTYFYSYKLANDPETYHNFFTVLK
jgi:gliding motility-associated-like protein